MSDRLNNSRLLTGLVAAAGFWFIVDFFARNGFDLDLNIMIFVFINTGLLLHHTPMRYVIAMKRACANVSGIIFQYPFYAGIMGIMMFTGLGQIMAQWLAANATVTTFPLVILPIMGAGIRIQARDVMGYLVLPFVWITVFTAAIVTWAPI